MRVPDEFKHLAHCFHQDSDLEASTAEEWIANALEFLRKPQQRVVKEFLTELLRGNPTGPELQEIWNGTGPDWGFGDDRELRVFLTMIRDMIP